MSEQIALITGASRGLGAALAVALAPTHHIVAVARTTGALEEVDDRIQAAGGSATLAPMDITNADAMTHMCGSLQNRWGHVDLWVHTAVHAAPLSPAGHIGRKDWDKSVAINITATSVLIPLVEQLLLAAPAGTALFLDDPRAGEKFFGAYGATKAAQIALARSWQAETVKIGPRVLIETPKPMPTATRARFFPGENRDALTPPADVAQTLVAQL
ncbi:MAG: SDR family oxidoreductase [Pseudomonadota bacterium]